MTNHAVMMNFNGGVLICTNGYHLIKTARDLARENTRKRGLTGEIFAEWTAGVHGQHHEKLDERRTCKIRPYV